MQTNTPDGKLLYALSRIELEEHFKSRIKHHIKRNEEKIKEASSIDEELEAELEKMGTVTDRMHFKGSANYGTNASRRDQLRQMARTHAQKATQFKFRLDHLPTVSSFFIDEDEATKLELVEQVWG